MLDTVMILFVAVAAILVAYRAMTVSNADKITGDSEVQAPDEPAKPKWAAGRQSRAPRSKR